MADSTKQRGPQDAQRVNINQDHEMTYWTGRFGVSPERLRQAVAKVGPMVKDVERELGIHASTST